MSRTRSSFAPRPLWGGVILIASCGCALLPPTGRYALPPPAGGLEGPRPVEVRDPQTGVVLHSYVEVQLDDGRIVKHGREQRSWPDGTPRAEREFDEGEPAGTWRTWWRGGDLRMEHVYDGTPRPMRFLHEGGDVAEAEGEAVSGKRQGPWVFRHANGQLAARGEYSEGLREGPWEFFDEAGQRTQAGPFEGGERVGDWWLAPERPDL